MPKYYTESGEQRALSTKDSAREAALDLVRKTGPQRHDRLAPVVTVSETGFDSPSQNLFFDTGELVDEVTSET